jgi:RHS repeat-associated protein
MSAEIAPWAASTHRSAWDFSELIRATGAMAKANPIRFSTKYQDDETDLVYYGYRYCSASTGRWNSRDPISDLGYRHANHMKRVSRQEKACDDFEREHPAGADDAPDRVTYSGTVICRASKASPCVFNNRFISTFLGQDPGKCAKEFPGDRVPWSLSR